MLSVLAILAVCGFSGGIVFVVSLLSSPQGGVGGVHVSQPIGAQDPSRRAPGLPKPPTAKRPAPPTPKVHRPTRRGGK